MEAKDIGSMVSALSTRGEERVVAVWDFTPGQVLGTEVERSLSVNPNCHVRLVLREQILEGLGGFERVGLIIGVSDRESHASAAEAFKKIRPQVGRIPLIAAIVDGDEASISRLIAAGSLDVISYSTGDATLRERVADILGEVEAAVDRLTAEFGLAQIIGSSNAITVQKTKAMKFAKCDAAVLITGETGSGKEVFARAIHYLGGRAKQPFVAVNCAALPLDLFENELFGHQAGAFTGATRLRAGLIQQADGGSLFLDEIDSLPLPAQAKLLRFLQEREYRPLGASAARRANVRIISAANCDLHKCVRNGTFREDLFFRLDVLRLSVPPLRDRREDIEALANHLLEQRGGSKRLRLSPDALRKLSAYNWPGNVRELENAIERAAAMAEGTVIRESELELREEETVRDSSFKVAKTRAVNAFECEYLTHLMAAHDGNITRAAKAAEKDRRAFFELLRKHRLVVRRSPR